MSNIRNLLTKYTSRKFLMALVPNVAAICAMFGCPENDVVVIMSAAVIIVSSVTYIMVEGKCDVASIGQVIDALDEAMELIQQLNKDDDETIDEEMEKLDEQLEMVESEYETLEVHDTLEVN